LVRRESYFARGSLILYDVKLLMKGKNMHQFDKDIVLAEQEPFLFKVNLTDNWSINGNPNGGYLMALLANAMLQHSGKKSTPIITANFISRCVPGTARVSVEKISRSNQFNRFQAILTQQGKERIRAFGTFAGGKDGYGEKRYEKLMPDMANLEECILVPEIPNYTLFSQIDLRLDPSCAGWMAGNLSDKSEQRGWIRFKDYRRFDTLSLFLLADSFPPPILASQGLVTWVPTLEFSVNIRNLPSTKWLKGFFRTSFINNGILEEDGELWDENGELIAISRQIAQYRKHNP